MQNLQPQPIPELVPPGLRTSLVSYIHKIGKHLNSLGEQDKNDPEALMGKYIDPSPMLVELVGKGEGNTPASRRIHIAAANLLQSVSARDSSSQHLDRMELAFGEESEQAVDALRQLSGTAEPASSAAVRLLQLIDELEGKSITKDPTTVVKGYLHDSKESIWTYQEEDGLTEAAAKAVYDALYEVEFEIEVDDEGKNAKIVRVNGRDLAPEKPESQNRNESVC